jgi:hypothetical protein
VTGIDPALLAALPLSDIAKVIFYKRDELTTDLICCDVETDGGLRTFHEEMQGWGLLIQHLGCLPGFRKDWFAAVSQPPFQARETLAFIRSNKLSLSV